MKKLILKTLIAGLITSGFTLNAFATTKAIAGPNLIVIDQKGDGVVDGSDFSVWNSAKFTVRGDPHYNICADANADGAVDGSDFTIWNSAKFTQLGNPGYDPRADMNNCGHESVTLDATNSLLMGNGPFTYTWKKGNTVLYQGSEPTTNISLPIGLHDITLAIDDAAGKESSDNMTVEVLPFGSISPQTIVNAGPNQTLINTKGDGFIDGSDLGVWNNAQNSHPGDAQYNVCADINMDGEINPLDRALILLALFTQPGDPKWNEAADINGCLSEDVILDASDSTIRFPHAPLTYIWKNGNTVVATSQKAVTMVTLPVGVHNLTLMIMNGAGSIGTGNVRITVLPYGISPENGMFEFSQATYEVKEDVGIMTLTINRTGGNRGLFSFNVRSVNMSAEENVDFKVQTSRVVFANGDTSPKTISIAITDDSVHEETESFRIQIETNRLEVGAEPGNVNTGVSAAQIPNGQIIAEATVKIIDNDVEAPSPQSPLFVQPIQNLVNPAVRPYILTLAGVGYVEADIYNLRGDRVRTLSGSGSITWDGRNNEGSSVVSDVYVALIKVDGQFVSKEQIIIVR